MMADLQEPWLGENPLSKPYAPSPATLRWVRCREFPEFLIDQVAKDGQRVDLGKFSSALRAAELFDNRSIDLPGAVIALPSGQRLLGHFCRLVRQHYEAAGLVEYDYPYLAPLSSIATFSQVFPADHRVLFVGTRIDFNQGQPLGVLVPTGEPIIYPHWQKIIKNHRDLPIEMYRHTRFFRPWSRGKSGRGIFNALEGADMFEFHGCYEKGRASEAGRRLFRMLVGLAEAIAVPILWSTRPPWSNYAEVSHATVGGDSPLPSGATLQVGTLYDQGDIFSRPYGISYVDANGRSQNPHHIVGALSRRLLLAHLLYGMLTNGSFLPHPEISPYQVNIVVRRTERDGADSGTALASALSARGLRIRISVADSSHDVARALKHSARLLVPLTIILQGRRHDGDVARFVLRRSDDLSEAYHQGSDFSALSSDVVLDALSDLKHAYEARIHRYLMSRCTEVRTIEDARAALQARKVVLCPLEFGHGAGDEIARWQQGEILGYVEASEPRPCIVSGRVCSTSAFVSPRA